MIATPGAIPAARGFAPAEREALLGSSRLTGSQWFERFGVRIDGIAESSRLNLALTPYLREPMDLVTDPYTREVGILCSTQVGKTTYVRTAMACLMHQDPAPTLFLMPTDDDAEAWCRTNFQPTIDETQPLARQLPPEGTIERRERITSRLIRFPRADLHFSGARVPKKVKSKPLRYGFADEVDEFPDSFEDQGDPLSLLRERFRWFRDVSKLILSSTFTRANGHAARYWKHRADHRRYMVPCLACGTHGVMARERHAIHGHAPVFVLGWDPAVAEADLERLAARPAGVDVDAAAWLECPACAARMGERDRRRMIARGRWVCSSRDETDGETIDSEGVIRSETPEGRPIDFPPGVDPTPATSRWRTPYAGLWLNCFYSPALSLAAIRLARLRAEREGEDAKKNFANSWDAVWFQERIERVEAADLRKRIAPGLKRGVAPAWTKWLVMTADTQGDRWKWSLIAFGPGPRAHVVDYGAQLIGAIDPDALVPEGWLEMRAIADHAYPVQGDPRRTVVPELVLVDSGYRTADLYQWVQRSASWWYPVKGTHFGDFVFKRTVAEYEPDPRSTRRATVTLYLVQDEKTKDFLHGLLTAPTTGAACMTFAEGCGLQPGTDEPDGYFEEMTAEEKRTVLVGRRGLKGVKRAEYVWVRRTSGAPNDFWDTAVYACAGAHALGLGRLAPEAKKPEAGDGSRETGDGGNETGDGRRETGGAGRGAKRAIRETAALSAAALRLPAAGVGAGSHGDEAGMEGFRR